MKIQSDDWVLYTINPCYSSDYLGGRASTQYSMFKNLPEDWQIRLNRIYGHYNYSYHSLPKNFVGLRLHTVLPSEGGRFGWKLKFLFEDLNKANNSIFNLPSGSHWRDGEMPEYEPKRALNGVLGFEAKKRLARDYVTVLCDHIVEPNPVDWKQMQQDWEKHSHEIHDLLRRLKMLEGRPMKANTKKFIVELTSYNIEKKEPSSEREYIILELKESHPIDPKELHNIVKSCYVDSDDAWCMLHGILKINDEYYTISSGYVDFTETKLNIVSNNGDRKPIVEFDMTKETFYRLKYSYDGKTGVETKYVPVGIPFSQIEKYYQTKYPDRNYVFTAEKQEIPIPSKEEKEDDEDESSEKPVTEETTKQQQELPKIGETPAKNTRKVCYKHKDSDKIYRAIYSKVEKLIEEDDNYEFVSKKAWKTQRVGHKSNITLPLSRRLEDLGKRGERRAEREAKKWKRRRVRHRPQKPSVEKREERAKIDRQKYLDKLEEEGRAPRTHPQPRCFQAVMLGPQGVIEEIIDIKAINKEHAEKQFGMIIEQKKNKYPSAILKLNGVCTDWKTKKRR